MKKILATVDLSSATVQVCNAARDLARRLDARLIILHVVPPAPLLMKHYAFSAVQEADITRETKKLAAHRLAALARWFHKSLPDTKVIQHTGPIVPTILRTLRRTRPDYLVVGSHGHSAAFEMLVGSVAHGLIRQADCPVVLVPIRRRRTRRARLPGAETLAALR